MIDKYRETYREEATELLNELESSLLEMEADPSGPDLVGRVFRALHTIKGSGAMFGFDAIAAFTHDVETVYDGVREGRVAVSRELIEVSLAARDHIRALLDAGANGGNLSAEGEAILERLRQAAPQTSEAGRRQGDKPAESTTPAPAAATAATYRIRFDPAEDIFLSGTNPVLLFRELESLGELSLIAHVERIPELEEFDTERCYTHWDAMLTTTAGIDAIRDVFLFVEDRAVLKIETVNDNGTIRVGDLLVDRGDVDAADIERALAGRPRIGEALVEAGLVTPDRVDAAMAEQRHLEAQREKLRKAETAATLKVPAAKLDNLVNVVGELVTVQARLSEYAAGNGESEIQFIAEEVQRLTEVLRETAMNIRMLPIGETFGRFRRLVRDLSSELGKKVDLVTEGNETELDKTVIDQLNDPLVHLIRNAIDHGIEKPAERVAAGKPGAGRIELSARHAGAFVVIRIADDGAGLNLEAIRQRAIAKGLLAPNATLTEQQAQSLIFSSGFSTAAKVSEISGRGVGMEVVQRSLEALRGTLSVTSERGRGTAVTLKIPLTLAIIEGLLVEAGGAYYVAPLSNVVECVELQREAAKERSRLAEVRGELVPYVVLREHFAMAGEAPAIEQVMIAETQQGRFGFVVDRVIGDHHTVIKKLGGLCRGADEFSGATILGDGSLALILDFDRLAAEAVRAA